MSRDRRPSSALHRRARALKLSAVIVLVVGGGVGVYVAARETSVFALRTIEVRGASPRVATKVRRALRSYLGTSLVALDVEAARRRLVGVADVADARLDRDFPHTLRVKVRQERAVAVLRQGASAWLVSSTARVLRPLPSRPYPNLPRIWVDRRTTVSVDATLGGDPAVAVAAVAPLRPMRLRLQVQTVRVGPGDLTLVLGSGGELRLGDPGDLRLKLAVARRILPLAAGAAYVDVSVPERPVASYNPQVED